MPSKKTNFGEYTGVRTERYQGTILKNAKEEDSKISKWTACKSEIMASKAVFGTLLFHHYHYNINKATNCCILSTSVVPSPGKQKQKQNSYFTSSYGIRQKFTTKPVKFLFLQFFHHIHLSQVLPYFPLPTPLTYCKPQSSFY